MTLIFTSVPNKMQKKMQFHERYLTIKYLQHRSASKQQLIGDISIAFFSNKLTSSYTGLMQQTR